MCASLAFMKAYLNRCTPRQHTGKQLLIKCTDWHAITSGHMLLTKLALPMDLLLTVGPLANVDMDGRSVPPRAISTSFGGCLELREKTP